MTGAMVALSGAAHIDIDLILVALEEVGGALVVVGGALVGALPQEVVDPVHKLLQV